MSPSVFGDVILRHMHPESPDATLLRVAWLRAVLPARGGRWPLSMCVPPLQSVLNRMHVVSVPYALMKANPLSWIQKVCLYKGEEAAASLQPSTAGSPSAWSLRLHGASGGV